MGDLAPEFGDPGPGGLVVHGALLERDVVAVDGGVGLADMTGDDFQFGAAVGVRGAVVVLGSGDRRSEEGVGVGVEVG